MSEPREKIRPLRDMIMWTCDNGTRSEEADEANLGVATDKLVALIQKEQGWRDELSDIIGELADRAAESDFGHFESARKLEKRAYELLPTPPQGEDG